MVKNADQIDRVPSGLDCLLDEVRAAHDAGDFERVLRISAQLPADRYIGQYGDILASALAELGRFDEAIDALDRYARDSGDDCHAPVERLKLLYLASRWPEVVSAGNVILADAVWFLSSNDSPSVWLMVAIAAAELGDRIGARKALKGFGSCESWVAGFQVLKAQATIRNKIAGRTCEPLQMTFRPKLKLVPIL